MTLTERRQFDSGLLDTPGGQAWDLLVIGGGSAGIIAAQTAAGFGASVLLVERDRTGGDCLWTGCVPSKALLAAAHAVAEARTAARYGVHIAGVRVAHGTARFTGSDTADVDGTTVRFGQALVATGSVPLIPPIPGLTEASPLTSDTVWQLTELPGRLLVLGGGSIGCELGQAFSRLGSQVSIVEAEPTLLPREDPYAGTLLLAALAEDGIAVNNGSPVAAIEPAGDGWRARLKSGSRISFDAVLVAVGRRPATTGLGLTEAGVEVDERGYVRVNGRLQTSNARIWAAGDVTGHPQFTHVAGVHGSLAASNAILGLHRKVDTATIPRVTFTQPEVAAFGVSPHQAGPRSGLSVRTITHDEVDRAIAEDNTRGVTRLVLDRKARIVGATIVGPRAGESIPELVLAARHGLRARDLASAIHAYPTYADGVWKAAIADVQDNLQRPTVRRVTRSMAAVRRRRIKR